MVTQRFFTAIVYFLAVLSMGPTADAVINAERVDQIWGSVYSEVLINKINEAKESIFVVMPHISFASKDKNSRVGKVLQALVSANRRGVFVFVLMNLDKPNSLKSEVMPPDNREAFFFFNDNGIDVHYEDIAGDLALKFVVFDKKEVLLGSSGWTETSLESPFELNFLFDSASFAMEKIDLIRKFDFFQNPFQADYYDQLYLSPVFLTHPNGFRSFVKRHDTAALKLYLYLLRKYAKESQPEYLVVHPAEILQEMAVGKKTTGASGTLKLRGLLERLQETYVLLEFEPMNQEGDYRVRLFEIGSAGQLRLPFCKGLRISEAYFEAGWQDKLMLTTQFVYFYLLSLETKTGYGTWFPVSQKAMNCPMDIPQDVYVQAVRELRAANLITAEYQVSQETTDFNFFEFDSLIMTPYFEGWYDEQVKGLVDEFGAGRVNRALRVAKEFLKDKDIAVVKQLINFLSDYPQREVEELMRTVFKPMPPENPFKTLSEFERLLLEKRRQQQAEVAEEEASKGFERQKAIQKKGRIVLDALTGESIGQQGATNE